MTTLDKIEVLNESIKANAELMKALNSFSKSTLEEKTRILMQKRNELLVELLKEE